AVWDGSTLALNGVNTAFHVSALPAGDTFAFKSDGHGGTELEVLPQTLAVGSTVALGVEQAAIPLHFSDTLTNDALTGGGVSLTAFVIGNIPAGATLSDGVHTQTVNGGTFDVAGWNLGSLTITPTNDANFTLSALATATDTNGFHYTVPASELVTVNPTAPALSWSAAMSGTETQVTLGNLGESITGQTGDSNAANTLTISGAPAGVVLSDGLGGHHATSDGTTAIDVSSWTLSSLSADTSGATVPAGNFTLTATATEVDGEGNVSSATTASEIVTVNPTAPTVTWTATVSGIENAPVALGSDLAVAIASQTGDSNTLNTLTISGVPSGAVLSDATKTVTSDGSTAINVEGWTLSSLTVTPTNDTNFTLTATATEKDANGDVSTAATASEAVTVAPEVPTVSPVAEAGVQGTAIALDLGVTVNGLTGDSNSLASVVVSAIPVGAILSDDQGHSFTATTGSGNQQVDVHGWDLAHLTITPVDAASFVLSVTATVQDAEGDLSAPATATEAVTVTAPVSAGPIIWTSEASDNWSVAGDWNNGAGPVPSASDQIQINSSVTVTIAPSDSVEIDNSLLLDSGATLTGGPLTLGSDGTLDIAGAPDSGPLGNGYPDATLDGVAVINHGT
ncbi:MAG: hypothetical protein P4L86_25120, partial [Mycobacterium sp.]|nr:hypothetical protein [Mycobacterium sp.]